MRGVSMGANEGIEGAGGVAREGNKWRTLIYVILVGASLFFGSILFILSRAPRP